ncbi:chromosome segregation protein SMC [Candidatus Micrarchaeota archaeon]|nr:chromosome segregation protein SMC [Candidatus Micrarchaeota archaeon]
MVFINRIQAKGFKSFKLLDIALNKNYICLAGPNGSGKSNICDAIRFGLGESRLKTLRAKKVSDLIMQTNDKAEILITLNGGKEQTIKRAIRRDGKTLYKLNGERMTRTNLLDALIPLGIDVGGHNIIAQGEVQRIVEMNAKQRREIIDRISGIAEFDDKRDEALSELAKVEQKISDANIVLKEREGLLTELERDKEDATKHQDITEELHRLKGSRIYIELKSVDEEHTKASGKYLEIKNEIEKIENTIKSIDDKIAEINKRKEQIVNEINTKGQRDSTYREIEALRANVSIDENKKTDKEAAVQKVKEREAILRSEEKELDDRLKQINEELSDISKQIGQAKSAIEKKKKEIQALQGNLGQKSKDFKTVKENYDSIEGESEGKKERLHILEQELSNIKVAIELKSKELERIEQEIGVKNDESVRISKELDRCKKQVEEMESQFKRVDENEKELIGTKEELGKKTLELKERLAVVKSRTLGKNINDGVNFVLQLRDAKSVANIYGTINELMSFKPEHAIAIEAAVGQRLNYIIVKDIDTASKAISELKIKKAGRCTFIPLDMEIGSKEKSDRQSKSKGVIGYLVDLIKFDKRYYSAISYAFGDTLLVEDLEATKKIGIGKVRMVTLEGDLLEVSGIVTGGIFRSKFFLADKKEAEKLEEELKECETKDDAIVNNLSKLKLELAKDRKLKAEVEVKAKSLEMELRNIEEKESREEAKKQLIENIEQEINLKKRESEKKQKEIDSLKKVLEDLNEKKEILKNEFELVSGSGNEVISNLDKEINELIIIDNSSKSKLEGKEAERSLIERRHGEVKNELSALGNEIKEHSGEIDRLKAGMAAKGKELKEKEESIKAVSKELEKLFSERNKLEKEVEKLANERGKCIYNNEKLFKESTKLEVVKGTSEARLTDLKAEYANYDGIKPLELSKDELDEKINGTEKELQALGNVNLKAPELYEEKKKDIHEIKEKAEKLEEERKSVLRMIDEIELKKKDIFMQTFKVVNDNFRNLFTHVMKGEGMLLLEKPEDIFISGLLLKVKVNNTEKYLESMSGGEKSLLALVFIFAIQMYKPAPFYILDEAEAALDKENSQKLANLLKELAKTTQFIVVTHNDAVLASADLAIGVTMTKEGSKIVGVNLT